MSKITLKRIFYLNWYGFSQPTYLTVSQFQTLISGINQSGKSVLLDGLTYAFIGETRFNKSAEGAGKTRSLIGYTRCLIDATAGTYARRVSEFPVVYSHIALEWEDKLHNREFITGVVIRSGKTSSHPDSSWYYADGYNFDTFEFCHKENGKLKIYTADTLRSKYKINIMNKETAMECFTHLYGLDFSKADTDEYKRKLMSLKSYNPTARIENFIKDSVLEAKEGTLYEKFKESQEAIDKVRNELISIDKEIAFLDEILGQFESYGKESQKLVLDEIAGSYKKTLQINQAIQETTLQKKELYTTKALLEEELEKLKVQKAQLDDDVAIAREKKNSVDGTGAIRDAEDKYRLLRNQEPEARSKVSRLKSYVRNIEEAMDYLERHDCNLNVKKIEVLSNLLDDSYSDTEKRSAVLYLREELKQLKENSQRRGFSLDTDKTRIEEFYQKTRKKLDDCRKNKPSFGGEQELLRQEIVQEFSKRNIRADVKFLAEHISGVKDTEWQTAIEAYVGSNRTNLIVPAEYYDVADEIYDKSAYKDYCTLVNTKLLMQKEMRAIPNSIYELLDVKNECAAQYCKYLLGDILACKLNEVSKYTRALSKEGKLSSGYTVKYIKLKGMLMFGQEAIRRNEKHLERQLKDWNHKLMDVSDKIDAINMIVHTAEEYLEYNQEPDYQAEVIYEKLMEEIKNAEQNIRDLKAAQKNNTEYFVLVQQYEESRKKREEADRDYTKAFSNYERMKDELKRLNKKEIMLREEFDIAKTDFESRKKEYPEETQEVLARYEGQSFESIRLLEDSTKNKYRKELDKLRYNLRSDMMNYRSSYKVQELTDDPDAKEAEGLYRARRDQIWMNDREEIITKISIQTKTYEETFKKNFTSDIYNKCNEAMRHIQDMNRELRKLNFSTKYRFDIHIIADDSDYGKIIRYARYLSETSLHDGQITMDSLGQDWEDAEKLEEDIRKLFQEILDKDDEMRYRNLSDYRNYMTYDILITDEKNNIHNGRLSKQQGYNSGAGAQIPYTVILIAALTMMYNARKNSVRLVFMDEPFEKMDDTNIKMMLDFFNSQDLQVILCAPDSKIQSIGLYCDTVIGVGKENGDNSKMYAGDVSRKRL